MLIVAAVLAFFLGGFVANAIATMDEIKIQKIEANANEKHEKD